MVAARRIQAVERGVLQLITVTVICTVSIYLLMTRSAASSTQVEATNEFQENLTDLYRQTFNQPPPPNYDKWIQFAKKHSCQTLPKEYLQIKRDFAPWKNKGIPELAITSFPLDNFNATKLGVFKTGKFSYGPSLFMAGIAELMPDKPFKYIINKHDFPASLPSDTLPNSQKSYKSISDAVKQNTCLQTRYPPHVQTSHGFFLAPYWLNIRPYHAPILSTAKLECFSDIVMPQYHHTESIQRVFDNVLWEDKQKVLFWRGRNTGGRYLRKFPWRKYHRTRLVQWEKEYVDRHPDARFDAGKNTTELIGEGLKIDIGFHKLVNCGKGGFCNEIAKEYPLKASVPLTRILQFKYLLVIDGHTWPDRLQWYLESNSVILYAGIFVDYVLWKLEPWVHFVPVRFDMSDLEERLVWLAEHDEEARQISLNAQKIVRDVNSFRAMQCYAGLVLLEYSRLYESDKNIKNL